MSKIKVKARHNKLEWNVMNKVLSNQISMRPRWYFYLGSVLMFTGLVSVFTVTTFLTHLTIFATRPHGPKGELRLQQIMSSFPLWAPVLAATGLVLGYWLLKRFDFSYKKNLKIIIIGIFMAMIITSIITNLTGLDGIWTRRGPFKKLYRQEQGYGQPFIAPDARPKCQSCGRYSF